MLIFDIFSLPLLKPGGSVAVTSSKTTVAAAVAACANRKTSAATRPAVASKIIALSSALPGDEIIRGLICPYFLPQCFMALHRSVQQDV
jgi:hypothetical protein